MRDADATVLQVVANLEIGGAQEVVRTLACYLPQHGWRPVVVTLRDGPLRGAIEATGVPVEVIPGRRRSMLAAPAAVGELLEIRRRLAESADRHHATVVQTHLLRLLDFVALSLRGRSSIRSVVWTVHNSRLELRPDQLPGQRWLLTPKRAGHRLLYQAGSRLVDAIVAVSDDVAHGVRDAFRPPAGRVATIPNGVDLAAYERREGRAALRRRLGLGEEWRVAIAVAKLLPQKGHAVLLDAVAPLLVEDPSLHVVLAGDGPLRAELEARVAGEPLAERVHLLGNRSDVPDLLAASDLFVLPSLWEGLPMALLEAMASRLPVVATAVSGSREVLRDGESGLVVPPGDPQALRAAMRRLIVEPELAARLSANGREVVEQRFSASAQAARHAALYRRVLAARGG